MWIAKNAARRDAAAHTLRLPPFSKSSAMQFPCLDLPGPWKEAQDNGRALLCKLRRSF